MISDSLAPHAHDVPGNTVSPRDPILFPAISAVLILCYATLLAVKSPEGFPSSLQPRTSLSLPFLADKPVGEDGYYMLAVAWNIARGRGCVGNEGKAVTGIQPLSTILFAGIARAVIACGGDKWDFVRAIILFGGLNLIFFGLLVSKLAATICKTDRDSIASCAFGLAVLNFWLFRSFAYGLETGIYLSAFAGAVLFSLRRLPSSRCSDHIILGVLAGVAGLSRIDFGLLFGGFLTAMLLSRAISVLHVALSGAVALAVVAPWPLWVRFVSGTFVPSSGPAQGGMISIADAPGRLREMGAAVVEHLTPWSFSVGRSGRLAVELVTLAAMVALAAVHRKRILDTFGRMRVFGAWCVGAALLIPVYTTFFWAQHFYARYISPMLVLWLPIAGCILFTIGSRVVKASRTLPLLFVLLASTLAGTAVDSLHRGRIANTHSVTAGFVHHLTRAEPTLLVGAFQSGVVGYFNENAINLDGKLNREALPAMRTHTIHDYIDQTRIAVLVDWPALFKEYVPTEWLASRWRHCSTQPQNESICYRRSPQARGSAAKALAPAASAPR